MKIDVLILRELSHRVTMDDSTFGQWWYLKPGGYNRIMAIGELFGIKDATGIIDVHDILWLATKDGVIEHEDTTRDQVSLLSFRLRKPPSGNL